MSKIYDLAYCFSLESYHGHPEVVYKLNGHNYICDRWHASLAYEQGWNDRVSGYLPNLNRHTHPATISAYMMGYDDAVNERYLLPATPMPYSVLI